MQKENIEIGDIVIYAERPGIAICLGYNQYTGNVIVIGYSKWLNSKWYVGDNISWKKLKDNPDCYCF